MITTLIYCFFLVSYNLLKLERHLSAFCYSNICVRSWFFRKKLVFFQGDLFATIGSIWSHELVTFIYFIRYNCKTLYILSFLMHFNIKFEAKIVLLLNAKHFPRKKKGISGHKVRENKLFWADTNFWPIRCPGGSPKFGRVRNVYLVEPTLKDFLFK